MKWWAVLAVSFHLGVFLFMGVNFGDNFLGYLIFINWGVLAFAFERITPLTSVSKYVSWHWVIISSMIFVFLKYKFHDSRLINFLNLPDNWGTWIVMSMGVLFALMSSVWFFTHKKSSAEAEL